jgi:putative FmdB family regulatory protein
MPLYEYECEKCARRFELRQGFDAGMMAECPECKSRSRRVFVPVPIIFKGSGFYVTDYRKEKVPSEEKKDSSKPAVPATGKESEKE